MITTKQAEALKAISQVNGIIRLRVIATLKQIKADQEKQINDRILILNSRQAEYPVY